MAKSKRRSNPARTRSVKALRFRGGQGAVALLAAPGGEGTDAASAGPPRFSMIAYTGAPMRPAGWYYDEPLVIELAGLEVGRKSRPILRDHDIAQVVGHSDEIRVREHALHIAGVVSGAGEAAREVLESSRNGFPWQASVGAEAADIEWIGDGQRVRVNGRDLVGPLAIARRSVLNESSFVALGADDDTVALAASKSGARVMTFKEWLEAQGFKEAELTAGQRTTLLRAFESEQADDGDDDDDGDSDHNSEGADADGGDDDDDGDSDDAVRASRRRARRGAVLGGAGGDRRARVRANIRELRLQEVEETARIDAIRRMCRHNPGIEAMAIDHGWTTERTELEVLRAGRPNIPGVRGSSADTTAPSIEIALARSCGVSAATLEARYRPADLEASDRANLRRIGLSGLFMEASRLAGQPVGIGGLQDDHIRAAIGEGRFVSASGSASTVSVPTILSNVANLMLLEGYEAVPSVVPSVAFERSVNDFKEVKSVRLVTRSAFEKVGPDGELKHASLTEQDYANRAETFGSLLTLNRQMIVNDSLDAFMRVLRMLGQHGRAKLERTLIETILSAPTGAAETNYFIDDVNWFDGADTALGIDSMTLAERAFFERIGPNNEPVLMKPSVLLAAPANKTKADTIYKSEKIASVEATMTPEVNPHSGSFKPAITPYLSEAVGLPGANNAAWYLLGDPNNVAAIEVCYLKNQRVPMVRSAESLPGKLGITFESVFDFGVALQDNLAIVGMKGKA